MWSPQWLHLFERVKIRARHTFDSSKTPEVDGDLMTPKHLADIDLSTLSTQIEALMQRARETDPAHLKLRIQALEEQLRKSQGAGAGEAFTRSAHSHSGADAELAEARRQLVEKEGEIKRLQQKCADLEKIEAQVNGASIPLIDVPNHLRSLHIETATITIGRADTLHGVHAHAAQEEKPERRRDSERQAFRGENLGPAPSNALSDQEQKTLSRLLKKIDGLTGNERALFTWLLTHDQQWIAAEPLASALCISVRATRADRTRHLDKIGFIHHESGRLRADFATYAQAAFGSDHKAQLVKHALLHAAC